MGTYDNPVSPHLGDMDNDGKLDLVLLNNGYGNFTVHYQLAGGGLGEEVNRPGGDIQQLIPQQDFADLGDVTGDGKLDIAYLGVNDGLVIIAQGSKPVCSYTGPTPARKPFFLYGKLDKISGRQMISGDMNGDGREDFLTSTYDSSNPPVPVVQIINQTADGGFSAGKQVPFKGLVEPSGLSAGDLNGDGRPDVAVTGYSTSPGVVGVSYQDANGNFLPPSILQVNDFPQQTYIADWTDDGRNDLAVIADGGITVLPQQADGSLGPAVVYNQGELGSTFLVDDVDWNLDGKLDLAAWWDRDFSTKPVRVFEGQAGGGFKMLPPARSGCYKALAAGDLNGDGRPDIAISCYSNPPEARLDLIYQLPDGSLDFRKIVSGPYFNTPDDMAIADLNFDGLNDILVMNASGFGISALTQNQQHTLDAPVYFNWTIWNTVTGHSIAQVDTDQDGKADVFAYASVDNYILFLKPVLVHEVYLPMMKR